MNRHDHLRVLVSPDKFKGCLTAAEVAEALAEGLTLGDGSRGVKFSSISVHTLPLADGGDGSVAAAISAGFAGIPIVVTGPDMTATTSILAFDGQTAIVEVANTSGLAMTNERHDAAGTTSHGVGDAINAALRVGASQVIVGLGGSATTDGGAGMLAALGARFLTASGAAIVPTGGNIGDVVSVEIDRLNSLQGIELIGACDVRNPLTGPDGAATVFAPQKGADAATVVQLEKNLTHLVKVLEDAGLQAAANAADLAGAGAAGGVGFAVALLGGRLVSGADLILDLLRFDDLVAENDLIVTGEGSLDHQTAEGKLISGVVRRAAGRPVFAVAGRSMLSDEEAKALGVDVVATLAEMTDLDTARNRTLSLSLLRQIGARLATGEFGMLSGRSSATATAPRRLSSLPMDPATCGVRNRSGASRADGRRGGPPAR